MTTVAAGLAALALTLPLSGCVTVHGAQAVVPAVSEDEAQEALDRYVEIKNEVNPAFDSERNDSAETRSLGEINNSVYRARSEVTPEGDPDYTPLEFSDPAFHIPQQSGWPKFFLADAATNRSETNRWLLLFTRDGPEEEWRVSYMASVAEENIPEFAEDEDGYAEPLTADDSGSGGAEEAGGALAVEPGDLSGAYADFLQEGEGPFTEGTHTTGELERRAEANRDAASAVQFLDTPATDDEYEPAGLRTADGGGLVFFTSHHSDQEDWAGGETPVVDQYVEAILEGTASGTVTTERLSLQTALVPPEGDAPVTVLARMYGVISAVGS